MGSGCVQRRKSERRKGRRVGFHMFYEGESWESDDDPLALRVPCGNA